MTERTVMGCCGPVESAAPIAVVINPEARVSVVRTKAQLGAPRPRQWHTIHVEVINEGFVSGPLAIEGEPVSGAELDLPTHHLTGEQHQTVAFRIRLDTKAADVTLTFRALSSLGGLASHSTIHFLIRAASNDQPNTEPHCAGLERPKLIELEPVRAR